MKKVKSHSEGGKAAVTRVVGIVATLPCCGMGVTAPKVENGRDKSRSVRFRIPYFPVRFRFLRDKRKRDRKRDGVKRERDRKG